MPAALDRDNEMAGQVWRPGPMDVGATTRRVRNGHLVLANGLRHPARTAEMATLVDHASGGRFALGIGSGSYPYEFRAVGRPCL